MINPKELRVGAHVDCRGFYREVCGILGDRIALIVKRHPLKGCETASFASDFISPIPITEELLTELGFEKKMLPTFPPRPYYIDAESAKLKAEGVKLVEPRIAISYAKVEFPFWYVEVHCEDMSDNRMAVRYLHELEQFLYLTTKTELIKE